MTSLNIEATLWAIAFADAVQQPEHPVFADLPQHGMTLAQLIVHGIREPQQAQDQIAAFVEQTDATPDQHATIRAVMTLCQLAATDAPLARYLSHTMTTCADISDDFDIAMLRVGHVQGWGSETHALTHLSKGNPSVTIVPLALYCVLRYPDSIDRASRIAVRAPKQSRFVGWLVGGLMGCRLGMNATSAAWRAVYPHQKQIDTIVTDLSAI